MKKIFLLAALACTGMALAEPIDVNELRYAGPYALQTPVMVDSVDVNLKPFDAKSLLTAATTLTLPADAPLLAAAELPATSDGYALHLAGFTLQNMGYAEVEVKVEGPEAYRLYVDGQEKPAGRLTLEPASHDLVVAYLTDPDHEARPTISVDAPKPDLISLNPTDGRMYTLADVVTGTRTSSVELSPDGKYLITNYRTSLEGGKQERQTQVTELATGKVVARNTEPLHWMPNSVKYYYTRTTPNGRELIAADPATGAETVLSAKLPEKGHFFFAPTEDYLLYTLMEEGPKEREDVYEVVHPDDRQPGWRDRVRIARFDLATGLMQPLTFGHNNAYATDISADGRYLLVLTSKSRLTARPTTLFTLLRVDLQTLAVDTLVQDDGFITQGIFSPDGQRVLIGGFPEALGGIGKAVPEGRTPSFIDQQLFLMNIADRSLTPLTKDFDPCVQECEWSKADGNIYLTAEDRDCVHLFRIDGKTLAISLLDAKEEVLKGFTLANNAPVMAYYGESATNAERIYTTSTKKFAPTVFRDLHAEQMSDIAFGTCEAWDYVNSRGDTVCGRFYLPPHFDATKQYPMIVNYYGGCSPTSRDFEGRYPHHAYAALGYVVYIVEPSGATGFGQEWSSRHVNTAGQMVADDIIEGVKQFCQEHPYVDTTKIGCIGASYGGFMTQYLQTQTDIFAAAISHAGISDHTSYWGEGYWGYSYSEVSMANSYPWTRKDLYVDQSPLFLADRVHTPILFVHGDADHNVPVGESIQMYTALKLLGRETAMVLVKDQDHHILEYTKRQRWQATIFAWFAKWLQGDDAWWESMYPKKAL